MTPSHMAEIALTEPLQIANGEVSAARRLAIDSEAERSRKCRGLLRGTDITGSVASSCSMSEVKSVNDAIGLPHAGSSAATERTCDLGVQRMGV